MALATTLPAAELAFDSVLHQLQQQSGTQMDRLQDAFHLAGILYSGRMHRTGVDLLEHCLGVVEQFSSFEPDEDAVIACLLHHALDFDRTSIHVIEQQFGATVRSLVSGVHLLSRLTTSRRRVSVDRMRMMFLRVADDVRILLIVLCDQRHLLLRVDTLPMDAQRRACADILEIFAPLAARLGIYTLKHQLEGAAFPIVHPTDASLIQEQLAALHGRYGNFLAMASDKLTYFLLHEGVMARVEGREKQPYSIFCKMKDKTVGQVDDIYDLFALRVIVRDESECYQTLGLLHRIGHPVSNRFKDYIAFPKPNGYQSLHTTLTQLPGVPDGIFVEVQIRTERMHKDAEFGLAAHWHYKERGGVLEASQREQLHRALAFQQNEEVTSLLSDHIFVLTPKGDVVELPERATPLDFAFHLHTDIGLSFKVARVNGMIVPLNYRLENGDVVEIVRQATPRPSPKWIALLRTAAARTRLKKFLGNQERPKHIVLGREMLNDELRKRRLPLLDAELSVLALYNGSKMTYADREDLLARMGKGSVKAASALGHIDALREKPSVAVLRTREALPSVPHVEMEGHIPMPVQYAKCCNPLDVCCTPIVGVIVHGRVRVHLASCRMIRHVNPERRLKATWKQGKA